MLAWDMGCGKSRAVVEYIHHRPGLYLILCPKSVVPVWPVEFHKKPDFVGRILVLDQDGTVNRAKAVRRFLDERPIGIVVCNYESFWRVPLIDVLTQFHWDMVIADESHRVKSHSYSARAARAICGLPRDRGLCLSGTPMPHSPLDIFAQYRFLDERIFGRSFHLFRSRYCTMGGYRVNGRPVQVIGYKNMDEFKERFNRIAHVVRKEEVLHDLPDQIDQDLYVELDTRSMRLYQQMEREMIIELEHGEVTAANAAVLFGKLNQIASGYVLQDQVPRQIHRHKLDELLKLIEGVERPVVIFCVFRANIDDIRRSIEDRPTFELSGRVNELEAWRASDRGALVVQVQAGGLGVDMTHASLAVYHTMPLSLGDYMQSRSRLHRPGQKNTVNYVHLLSKGTIDEKIRLSLLNKHSIIDSIMSIYRKERESCSP